MDDLVSEVEAGAHFFEQGLILEPVLITARVPAGDIIDVEAVTAFGEFVDDESVRGAVMKHEVQELALFGRQASGLAGAAMGRTAVAGLGGIWGWNGWRTVVGVGDVRLIAGLVFHGFCL